MPHPLSILTPDEQHLYAELASEPLAADTSHILADTAEEQGQERRADLLRQQSRLALLELLRGQSLTEQECAEVAARIHALLPTQEPAPAVAERELSAALGPPHRGEAMLALLDPEGNLDAQRLREQYDFQVTLLASLDLLEEESGHLGITGIDAHFHPLPSFETIHSRLQAPALRQKIAQGFNQLLLVPFALPLQHLLDAWRQDLRRNEHLIPGGLDRDEPLDAFDAHKLAYFPQRFPRNHLVTGHGGGTKVQILAAEPSAGWQVLLTESGLSELPQEGHGQTRGARPQIEAVRTLRQYLADLPKGEVGWTPETNIAAFCTALERAGQVLDWNTMSYLTASYLPASGDVPDACWYSGDRRALLGGSHPIDSYPGSGARAAVRVV